MFSYSFYALLFVFGVSFAADSGIVVSEVDRTIDLTTQLVKMVHKMTFTNSGSSEAKNVQFALESKVADYLAFIEATVRFKRIFSGSVNY